MDLLMVGREIGAEAERVRWEMRLRLFIADTRAHARALGESTTREQAAINLEEVVEELAAPPGGEHPRPSTPAPSSPSDEQP